MPRGEDLYHTGVVVDDFDQALAQLSARAGHQFAEPMASSLRLRTPAGELTVDLLVAYSRGPGPLVEVIKAVPGTHWQPVAGSGLHHLGYWVDDIDAESAALSAAGMPLEAAGLGPDGQIFYVYHYEEDGVRIELVDRKMKPFIDELTS
jgi:catechol 2,3-dioxygenase-like lactoylglutathione lyase family enzyme